MPYFIASHPGSDLDAMIDLALFLKRNDYQPDQVQDFIPSPFDIAACMYHTGLDPFTKKPVYIAKHLRDRKLQRALLQFFKPENYFEVRKALEQAGRQDLIGSGCDCLIPARPPKEALDQRRKRANERVREQTAGDHIRSKPGRRAIGRNRKTAAKRERNVAASRPALRVAMFASDHYRTARFRRRPQAGTVRPVRARSTVAGGRRITARASAASCGHKPPLATSAATASADAGRRAGAIDRRLARFAAGRSRWN